MECPRCKAEIGYVRVYSECWQKGVLEGDEIVHYGSVEEITETVSIECPECNADIIDSVQ